MYLDIYIDVLFLINFGMNLLILDLERKILKWSTRLGRIILSAFIGAAAACVLAIYPNLYAVIKIVVMYLVVSVMMICVAFPVKKGKALIKGVTVLFLLTYCIGGIISSIYYQRETCLYYIDLISSKLFGKVETQYLLVTASASAIIVLFLADFLKKQKSMTKEIYDVELIMDKVCVHARGLVDTGNCLYDPITGKPVIVVELRLIRECISANLYEDLKRVIKLEDGSYHISNENVTKIRLIPFQSIGKKRGILPAIVFDEIYIRKESLQCSNKRVIAAVYDDILSQSNEYQIILHKSLL